MNKPTEPVDGLDNPDFQAPEEESILANTDGETLTPDGSKGEVHSQKDFNQMVEDHMMGEPAPSAESEEESGDEIIDEGDILKRHELEFENVDDLAVDYKSKMERISELGELLKKGGMEVSDNPMQDLIDVLEANLMQQQPGIFGGQQGQTPQTAPTPETMTPSAPAPPTQPPPSPQGTYTNTDNFTRFYPQLKWTPTFFRDLAGALSEHLPKPEAPSQNNGDFVSRREAEALVNLNKRLFRDQVINEHTLERLSAGGKLPKDFRKKLAAEVDRNPTPLERAWRGYWRRGRYDGVMQEYSKHLMAERDPSTGLTGAETEAQAEEVKRAAAEKKTLKGGTAPTGGAKKRKATEREMEAQIEAMQKDLI